MRRISRLAVAAAIVLGVVGAITWLTSTNGGASVAFADVLEKVNSARTCVYRVEKLVNQQTGIMKSIEPNHLRGDGEGQTSIVDLTKNKALELNHKTQVATRIDLTPEMVQSVSFLARLRELPYDGAETVGLGHRNIAGINTVGFRVVMDISRSNEPIRWIIWVNSETALPVRIEVYDGEPEQLSIVMDEFRFDVELDESLFDLTPPAGYEVNDQTE